MSKLALNMIVKGDKDEAKMLRRCLETVAPHVDGIFITLTNPDKTKLKGTRKVCQDFEAEVTYFKWVKDFAKARNFAMAQVPKEFGWFIWLDADDILRGGEKLKSIISMAEEKKADSVFFNYLYQVNLDKESESCDKCGQKIKGVKIKDILIEHMRERLIKHNGAYKWVGAIHETVIEQRPTRKLDSKDCDVVHLSDTERFQKAIKRNIEILKIEIKRQKGKDPRPIYYLAKAYYDLHTKKYHDKAEPLLYKYLGASGWAEERCQAWEYLSEIYRERGEHNKSVKCCWNALNEAVTFPSTYLNLALAYMMKSDWDKALHWVQLSGKVPMPRSTLVTNPRDLAVRALNIIYNVAIKQSNIDQAWAASTKLKNFFPSDEGVEKQVKFTTYLRQQREVSKLVMELAKYLKSTGEQEKLKPLIAAIPKTVEQNPFMVKLKQGVLKPREWGKNEVAIYCGPGWTKWSPLSIENPSGSFVGGSEEAVIYMADQLGKLGWKVTVFADPGDEEGEYKNGATWLPYYKFNPKDEFNILVGWRNPSFVDGNYSAKAIYIWCHDVQNQLAYTEERLNKIEKVIVLSEAHRGNIPKVPDNKVMISSNGWAEHFPDIKPKNNPYRCIWTSSYDRGLQHLLKIWPDVRKAVPQAELHVFYGWQLFKKFYANNPERMAWMKKIEELMKQDGVTHHGRVTQPEIERWHKKCGIWAYPTDFFEINCITAIKSQLWGCVPVVINYAALETTVQYGTKVEGEIYDPDVRERFKKELIKALKDHKWQDEQRKKMMPWARKKFAWRKIAEQWSADFAGGELFEAMQAILKHDKKLAKFMPTQLQRKHGLKTSS